MMENIFRYTLPNQIRIVHKAVKSDVAYCGFIVNTGTRDEDEKEVGIAHFTEHLLYKGAPDFTAQRIINQIENVGAEMNAYTTKEETVLYAAVLNSHLERIVKLMSAMFLKSMFPQNEIDKELDVILDEIESYNDSPSELIFDDFEALLFSGNSLGNPILGEKKTLKKMRTKHFNNFIRQKYNTDQIVFFSQGNFSGEKIFRLAQKYFGSIAENVRTFTRHTPTLFVPQEARFQKDTHQTHFVCGNVAYGIHHPNRLAMYFLNNILGGPGMSSKLNMSLRERNGLVYGVESNYTPLTDIGYWSVYFGSDPEKAKRCEKLLYKELAKLRNTEIPSLRLHTYKQQLCGQMAIANENQENNVLAMGKRIMHFNDVRDWRDTFAAIEKISSRKLLEIANEIFDEKKNIST